MLCSWVFVATAFLPAITSGFAVRGNLPRQTVFQTTNLVPKQAVQPTPTSLSANSIASLTTGGLDPTVALASVSATAKLLAALGIGAYFSRANILDKPAISALSRLTYNLFQPAFLLVSVGATLARATMSKTSAGPSLWLMPVIALVQIGMSAVQAFLMSRTVLRNSSDAEKRQVRMCTTFQNAGPLPLIYSQALLAGTPALASQAVACISFYLLAWSPLFWTWGQNMLVPGDSESESGSLLSRVIEPFKAPPVLGSILGMLVGSIPAVRKAIWGKVGMGQGWAFPFLSALQTLGSAYLPSAMLVLAGSLCPPSSKNAQGSSLDTETTSEQSRASVASLLSIFSSRYLISPFLAMGLLRVASPWLGPVGSAGRAVFAFIILMEGCTPPAQNSVIMLQLAGATGQAQTMAQILTFLYAAAVIPLTFWLSTALSMSGILSL